MANLISALVPLKEHSQRLPDKNFRLLHGQPLYHWLLTTLQQVPKVTEIIINTDSQRLIQANLASKYSKVKIIMRQPDLLGDDVSMNSIIKSSLKYIKHEHCLQTHFTNPLLTPATIKQAIKTYFSQLKANQSDSLFSVTGWHKRFYYHNQPINHSLTELIQTQDLEPVYEENSNIYLFSKSSFKANHGNRVGLKPLMIPMEPQEAVDIDYLFEFKLAEALLASSNA